MKITVIGAGNVGYHLSQRLKEMGHTIVQVFSRRTDKVLRISKIVGAEPIDNLASVNGKADLYILAVKDDAIGLVAEKLAKKLHKTAWIVHTSGATPSTILAAHFYNYGIFYPLQTFSIARMPDFLT
ncbi:MAG: NAD(P)-binding domain-containing protein, partial [Saprospiraceae bacterium]